MVRGLLSMSVLVTGAAGFVGRHLLSHLLAVGDGPLFGLVRVENGLRDGHPVPRFPDGVEPIVADLLDRDQVREALRRARPTHVYHLAAQSSVAESLRDPLPTLQDNIAAQVNLFEALLDLDLRPRILVVGSNEEYGAVPPEQQPIRESTELRPVSPYGVSKVAQDLLGYVYFVTRGLPVVRVRPFVHTGPGQPPRFATPGFARQVAAIELGLQEPVLRVGSLDSRRDVTDVRDMVRAHRLALLQGDPGEVYNLGSGSAIPVRAILDGLLRLSRASVRVEVDPQRVRPSEAPLYVADSSKFRDLTGWRPEIPLGQTLADVLEEWRGRLAAETAGQ